MRILLKFRNGDVVEAKKRWGLVYEIAGKLVRFPKGEVKEFPLPKKKNG